MTESTPSFTPPSIERQYTYIHKSNIASGRVEEMQRHIAETGIYEGEIMPVFGPQSVIEVIDSGEGEFVRVMPNAIRLPYDHPVRRLEQETPSEPVSLPFGRTNLWGDIIEHHTPNQTAPNNELLAAENQRIQHEVFEMDTNNHALARFLQRFVKAADENVLGYGYGEAYKLLSYRGTGYDGRHCLFVGPSEKDATTYALLRCDRSYDRRPYNLDEHYTIVNMSTGDALDFRHSDIARVREGRYAAFDEKGYIDTIDPRSIAAVAGIINVHDVDDPLKATPEGALQAAVLKTDEQIERFERLVSLGIEVSADAPITFAPDTVDELMRFLTRLGSDGLAGEISSIQIPEGASFELVVNKEQEFCLKQLVDTAQKFDTATQAAIYAAIGEVRIDMPHDAWKRSYELQKLLHDSVRMEADGSYAVTPLLELLKRTKRDKYDFLEAIYKAAGGLYVESSMQKAGEKTTTRRVTESLDETKARAYAGLFEAELLEVVKKARGPYGIPDDVPYTEQIVTLLKHHGFTQKGMRLHRKDTIIQRRPDVTIPEWAEICMIIDRCRTAPITEEDRHAIQVYNLNPDKIAEYWRSGPGSSAEHIAEVLVRF